MDRTSQTVDELRDIFASMPRRIYLDTSILQTIFDYGEAIWDNVPFTAAPRDAKFPGLDAEVEALRLIFAVNQRAQFEFVVTAASLGEVMDRGMPSYTQWVRDVEDTWLVQAASYPPLNAEPEDARIGSVSARDWVLIADSLATRCDSFLTLDRPLLSQAPAVRRTTGLRLMDPVTYWALLRPWAALYL